METVILAGEKQIKEWLKAIIYECLADIAALPKQDGISMEPLLTRKAAAAKLNISLVTLHAWMKNGLPWHKHEGKLYFLESEIREFVLRKKEGNRT